MLPEVLDVMVHFSGGNERELAMLILDGSAKRPQQLFGSYFEGTARSDAFGAAYEGLYRLPADATGIRPKGLYRFFPCLDNAIHVCPGACGKRLLLDSLLIHLNDEHRWSRERIADWLVEDAAAREPAS